MSGIYGLSGSGMDIDALVKSLMKAPQLKYDSLQQKETLLEWKKADYNTMYTSINSFRSTTVFNNKLQSTLMPKKVTSSDDTKVSVTANADAGNVNHSVNVTQLATGVTETSSSTITATGNSKDTIATQFGLTGTAATTIFKVKINDKEISVDPSKSINEFASQVNSAGANVKLNYDATLDRVFLYTTNSGASSKLDFTGSDATGADFLTKKLKLNTVMTIGATGAVSTANLGLDATKAPLSTQFAGLPATFNLDINGTGVAINTATDTIGTLLTKIKAAGLTDAQYDSATGKINLTGTSDFSLSDADGLAFLTNNLKLPTGSTLDAASSGDIALDPLKATLANQFSGLTGSFNLKLTNGGVSSTLVIDTTNKSLQDIMTSINAAGVNASATYDATSGKFTLKATSGTLDLTGSDTAAFDFLNNNLNLWQNAQQGQDAKFVLDGASLTQTSNNFSISGVTYNLKSTGTVSVNITSDTDKIVANVKSFIADYNANLDKMNTAINATRYSTYLPLTPDQRTSMKDTEITAWELKAKSGLLRNDSILKNLVSTMRSDLSTAVSGLTGDYTSASSLGITTGGYQEGGKLYLNETKLNVALQADPEIVSKIFSTHTDGNTHAQDGIAVRLYDTLKAASDKIVTEAGATSSTTYDTKSNVAIQIAIYQASMTTQNTKMTALQTSYYTKFNAMEVALSKLNQQSTWLSQQTTSST